MAALTVEHHFTGDRKLLNATIDRRNNLRSALTALHQDVQRLEGHPVQLVATINFNVLSLPPKTYVYTVDVTDSHFDPDSFAATTTNPPSAPLPAPSDGESSLSGAAASTSRPRDHADARPTKRARTDQSSMGNGSGSTSALSTVPQRLDDLHTFMNTWHDEWTRQGGWLFDCINAIGKAQKADLDHVDKKLDTLQDVIGLSINSACATNMTELSNISKLLPWLEHCRKTNADKVEAREEKWRSSSATFHHESRQEREAAEARLEKKLEAQRHILIKLAEMNGIDVVDEDEDHDDEDHNDDDGEEEDDDDEKHSEASLGAQLTAELNSAAQRAE